MCNTQLLERFIISLHSLVLQFNVSSLERTGSTSWRTEIRTELAPRPFLLTVSITSRALSALPCVLADCISSSVITPRSRSLSRSWFRTGSDTRSTNCVRTCLSMSSGGSLSSAGSFLRGFGPVGTGR